MSFKVWEESADVEYGAVPSFTSGGNFGDILTVVDPLLASDTGVGDGSNDATTPARFALIQNYPNPFNPETTIVYHVTAPAPIRMGVYDVLGHRLRTLVDGTKQAGRYTVSWDGQDEAGSRVCSGSYFVRLEAPNHTETLKIQLVQ